MRAGGGRAKGAAFEREVCKLIELATGRKLRRRLSQYQEKDLSDLDRDQALNQAELLKIQQEKKFLQDQLLQ